MSEETTEWRKQYERIAELEAQKLDFIQSLRELRHWRWGMSDGKYGGQYDQHDGNCLVCGRMLNKKNECSLCDSIEAPLLNRIEALEAERDKLREEKAQQYQLARYYRTALQEIRDKTPANCHKEWPHHHWYLAKASAAINHKLEEGGE